MHPHRGDNKLDTVLKLVVEELKSKKQKMPLTLIYGNLDTISDCFLYFTQQIGRGQHHPSSAKPVAKKRLFSQYHAQYPEHEQKRIVDKLVSGKSTHCVLFVTAAFGIGIDCNNIRRIIHIGVPYTMEEYCQEVGRAILSKCVVSHNIILCLPSPPVEDIGNSMRWAILMAQKFRE